MQSPCVIFMQYSCYHTIIIYAHVKLGVFLDWNMEHGESVYILSLLEAMENFVIQRHSSLLCSFQKKVEIYFMPSTFIVYRIIRMSVRCVYAMIEFINHSKHGLRCEPDLRLRPETALASYCSSFSVYESSLSTTVFSETNVMPYFVLSPSPYGIFHFLFRVAVSPSNIRFRDTVHSAKA